MDQTMIKSYEGQLKLDTDYDKFDYPMIWDGESSATIKPPKFTARIAIGNFIIQVTDKTFTDEQIKNMREMLGWEVTNL